MRAEPIVGEAGPENCAAPICGGGLLAGDHQQHRLGNVAPALHFACTGHAHKQKQDGMEVSVGVAQGLREEDDPMGEHLSSVPIALVSAFQDAAAERGKELGRDARLELRWN